MIQSDKAAQQFYNAVIPWLLSMTVVLGLSACSKKSPPKTVAEDDIVAQVADQKITTQDFLLSYELFAHVPSQKSGQAAKQEQLEKLVQHKLFALQAKQLGMDKDTSLQKYLDWYRKKAAVRELYRQEVAAKVQISDAELRQAFIKSKTKIRARHLYARTAEEAEILLDKLRAGESFESLAAEIFRDSTLANNGGDIGYFSWGDMDENFEAAAYALRVGEISPPVRSQYGWHIIQVTDIQKEVMLTESEFESQKQQLTSTLKRRKEAELARYYIKTTMAPQQVVLKGKVFSLMAKEFDRTFGPNQELLPPFMPNIYTMELNQLANQLSSHLSDTLLTFHGGAWTVAQLLAKLTAIPITDRPIYKNPEKLREDIGTLFRDEVLAEIAQEHDLDQKPAARQEWQNRWDDALYSRFVGQIIDTIRVSDGELQDYYEKHSNDFSDPEKVNIREIFVRSKTLADSLYRCIRRGGEMAQLARRFTQRPWAAKQDGEFGYFTREAHGEISRLAFQGKVGELIGPVEIAGGPPKGGYSLFRILGKRPASMVPLATVKANLEQQLLLMKREACLNHTTEQLKKVYPVELFLTKITQLKTIDDYSNQPVIFFPITNY